MGEYTYRKTEIPFVGGSEDIVVPKGTFQFLDCTFDPTSNSVGIWYFINSAISETETLRLIVEEAVDAGETDYQAKDLLRVLFDPVGKVYAAVYLLPHPIIDIGKEYAP